MFGKIANGGLTSASGDNVGLCQHSNSKSHLTQNGDSLKNMDRQSPQVERLTQLIRSSCQCN